jgi:hypothetical protein
MRSIRTLLALETFFFAVVCAAFAPFTVAAPQSGGVPLVVVNNAPVARTNEGVASGLALPEGAAVHDLAALRLVDAQGTSVPVQFKALARWHGERDDASRPLKWVLIELCATVPANQTKTYYLMPGAPAQGQMTLQNLTNEVVVNTGAATFKIDKTAFTVLKSVSVGGTQVAQAGAFEMLDSQGGIVGASLTSTSVEENGSVRSVVCQRGTLSPGGLDFTARYFFWHGQTDVRVEFRLENNQSYGLPPKMGTVPHNEYFDQLHLAVRLSGTGTQVGTSSNSYTTNGATFELKQDWLAPSDPLQMLSGFGFTESVGGSVQDSGNRHAGAVSISTGTRSVAACVDRFWQNFPKSFTASGNKLSVGLWPSFGSGPLFTGQFGVPSPIGADPLSLANYRFEGGRWKTYATTLSFKSGAAHSSAELASMAEKVNNPLMCRLQDLSVAFTANAFGQLLTERRPWNDVGRDRYERILDVMAKDSAASNQPSLGQIGLPGFHARGGTYGGQQSFGWENFGDIPWGDGYSSLHYDHNWGVLINWYRTGDYAFFDVGRDMAAHRRDYDQYHSRDTSDPSRGGQFYEKGHFHGNFGKPEQSHTWVGGLLLYYAMTGDEGSREAALEVASFLMRANLHNWNGWSGARILGWNLENLVDLYNYVGDPAYITRASATADRWNDLDLQNGGGGFVLNPGYGAGNEHAEVWMHSIVMNALAKYFYATADGSVLPSMARMASWMCNSCIATMPSGSMSSRTVARVWTDWAPTFQADPSIHHCWGVIEALANAALCTQNFAYFTMADTLFESTARYFQGIQPPGPMNYTNTSSFCPIAYRLVGYPGAESKIMSNIAKWGHAYLTLARYVNP